MNTRVKEFSAKVEKVADRTLKFTLSTSAPDRQHDRVLARGWQLANFRKAGGPVLWAHDQRQPPIGRAVDVRVVGDRLVASAEFVPKELSPFADSIYQLIKAGYLSGTSVGFRPLEWTRNDLGGMDFTSAELLEFSICPIGVHPEALVDPATKANMSAIQKWMKSAPVPRREVVFRLKDDPPQKFTITREMLGALLAVTFTNGIVDAKRELARTVDARVAAAFRKLRGRLD